MRTTEKLLKRILFTSFSGDVPNRLPLGSPNATVLLDDFPTPSLDAIRLRRRFSIFTFMRLTNGSTFQTKNTSKDKVSTGRKEEKERLATHRHADTTEHTISKDKEGEKEKEGRTLLGNIL